MYEFVKKVKPIPDYFFIRKHPTEEEQLDVVKRNGKTIQYIDNPSEAVQFAAVRNYGFSIRHIVNPSEAVKLSAVRNNGWVIDLISDPTEEMKLIAVKRFPFAINYIVNPTEEMKMIAVKKEPSIIFFIRNASEEIQLAAVENFKIIAVGIKDPIEKVKKIIEEQNILQEFFELIQQGRRIIVHTYGDIAIFHFYTRRGRGSNTNDYINFIEFKGGEIKRIDKLSEEEKIYVVQVRSFAIQYIKNPTEIVQLKAVQRSPNAIKYIKNPSEAAQLAALPKVFETLHTIETPCFKTCVIYYLYQFDKDYQDKKIKVPENVRKEIDKMQLRRFNIETYQGQRAFLKEFPDLYDCIMKPLESIKLEMIEKNLCIELKE